MTKFYKEEQKIINWLDKYEVKNYKLLPDEQYGFIVNVTGYVDLSDEKFLSIPIKFSEVTGSFNCSNTKITSLEFCPQTVGGNFDCSHNQLTSLKFCPQTVNGSFYCSHNKLASLEFSPQTIGRSFYCDHNPKLKEIQKISDFKLIFLEHKKILIAKFSDKLENDLSNDNSKKITKIKI